MFLLREGNSPITILKELREEERDRLSSRRILTLKQLVSEGISQGISPSRASELMSETIRILEFAGGSYTA